MIIYIVRVVYNEKDSCKYYVNNTQIIQCKSQNVRHQLENYIFGYACARRKFILAFERIYTYRVRTTISVPTTQCFFIALFRTKKVILDSVVCWKAKTSCNIVFIMLQCTQTTPCAKLEYSMSLSYAILKDIFKMLLMFISTNVD